MTTISALLAAAAVLALAGLCLFLLRRDERRIAEARERAALRGAIARLVHHVRNPVQSILLHADLLSAESAEAHGHDETRRAITMEAERLAGMLRELSEFAAGPAAELDSQPVAVTALLRELARRAPPDAAPLEVEGSEEAVVLGDPGQLRQALEAIIENARHAVADRQDPRVTASVAVRGGLVELDLSDNGDGIPSERLGRVFEPFVSWTPRALGLGLTTVREVVERHGGRVTLESGQGAGTRVRIVLPRAAGGRRRDRPNTTLSEVRSD